MALEIRRDASIKVRAITTLMMAFTLVVQPMYGFVAHAVTTDVVVTVTRPVVINEIMVNPLGSESEWVELYNPNTSAVDLSGWTLSDVQGHTQTLNGSVAAKGHVSFDFNNLNNPGDTVTLKDVAGAVINDVTYTSEASVTKGKSYARTYDAASSWVAQANHTKGISNGTAPVVLLPKITAENFNTHSAENYDGVSVGFNVKDFKDVKSVKVTLERESGGSVVKTAAAGVLKIINDDGKEQLTTPFIITGKTFTEATDKDATDNLYWNPASATTWTDATRPTNAIVEIVNGDDTLHILNFSTEGKTFVEPDGVTYESLMPPVPAVESTVVIRGNTSAGENQPGWAFNRDPRNITPYAFVNANPSVGSGSIYIKPITNTVNGNADKFVAENFLLSPIKDINSISYDYQIGSGGDVADDAEFYMNVYANFGSSDPKKFYDCRYDVIPTIGSTSAYTKVMFDLNQSHAVTTRSGALHTCPAKPADMEKLSAGSTIRMFSLNVGDTSASDTGLDGYLDNVIVNTKSTITTYDFEADTTAPLVPAIAFKDANDSQKPHTGWTTTENFSFNLTNPSEDETTRYQLKYWNSIEGSRFNGQNNAWTQTDLAPYSSSLGVYKDKFTQGQGTHYFTFSACDAAGNCSTYSDPFMISYDKTMPEVSITYPTPNQFVSTFTTAGKLGLKGLIADNLLSNYAEVQIVDAIGNSVALQTVYGAFAAGSTFATFNTKELEMADGKYGLVVRAVDGAGNVRNTQTENGYLYFNLDNTAPIASITSHNDGDTISGSVKLIGQVDDANPMNTYFRVTGPNKYVKTDLKTDGRPNHELVWDVSALSNGTYTVQFETRDLAGNKTAVSTKKITLVVDNPQPVVNGENFNTHSGTDYKGINVGFNIDGFKTVTGVTVDLYDEDGNLLVSNTHNQELLDLIAGGVKQLSTPFITDAGTYVEEYWTMGTHTWTAADKPAKAIVTVTGTNHADVTVARNVELTPLSEPNDWTFESVLPVVVTIPVPTDVDETPAPITPGRPNNAPNGGNVNSNPIITGSTFSPLQTPASIFFAQANGNGGAADADDTAVLGTQSDSKDDVKGTSDKIAALEASDEGWKFLGVPWYWILLLIAAISAVWYLLARRRRNQDA